VGARRLQPAGAFALRAGPLGVSVLVNNAGIGDWNDAWDVGIDRLHEMIDLNVRALAVLSVLFVKDNKNVDAQATNVASAAGYALFGDHVHPTARLARARTGTQPTS
jgi:short-subunit dehydrogenase